MPPKPWYIDGFGSHYLELYAHRNEREAARALGLLDRAGIELEGRRVLDLACGAGRHMAALQRRGARVLGLDLSPQLLAEARGRIERGASGLLLRADMRDLPLRDGSFDGVLSMFTSFGYFPEDRENWKVFDEVARVLRPGGFYFFDFLNRERVLRDLRAESEHETESLLVRERRRIREDRVLKEVRIFDRKSGRERLSYEESVRLFRREEILSAAAERGLHAKRSWGDYSGRDFEEEGSPRLILLFESEAP